MPIMLDFESLTREFSGTPFVIDEFLFTNWGKYMRCYLILLFLTVMVSGCQDAAALQRAEQARAAATAGKLKAMGKKLHANSPQEPPSSTSGTDPQVK